MWDRVQRQDLELREAHRRINQLLDRIDELTGERDRARLIAQLLEEEVANGSRTAS